MGFPPLPYRKTGCPITDAHSCSKMPFSFAEKCTFSQQSAVSGGTWQEITGNCRRNSGLKIQESRMLANFHTLESMPKSLAIQIQLASDLKSQRNGHSGALGLPSSGTMLASPAHSAASLYCKARSFSMSWYGILYLICHGMALCLFLSCTCSAELVGHLASIP